MRLDFSLDAPCSPAQTFPWIADLDRYGQWLTILDGVEPAGVGWFVELRGKLGPFARSKRLRMERIELRQDECAVFERREIDGRNHAMWRLEAAVTPTASGSHLAVGLQYEGALWGTVVERLLDEEVGNAKARLLALVAN